ncbi:RNA polymerase II subunit A C-terminal domain phosphatase [Coemansia sp. RSA 1939]|nr:RNA polymerase II subunit A C-terminal domain phosphatase [Coemansia sp. RSA 1939]
MVKFAVICASNMNRSMEAHYQLKRHGYNIRSFGTGSQVRLPGPTAAQPNIYGFGTAYDKIYNELRAQDKALYTRNGLLAMLERNRTVKQAPQRFHSESVSYDIIFTCEERVFDAVCEELLNRSGTHSKPVHVINIEIEDNHKEATIGAKTILELARLITESKDLERDMDGIIEDVQNRMPHNPLFNSLRYTMTQGELILMRVLGFNVNVELPHTWIAEILYGMAWWRDNGHPPDDTEAVDTRVKQIASTAWRLANEVVVAGLVDRFPARSIGAACIVTALRAHKEPLPVKTLDEWAKLWAKTSGSQLALIQQAIEQNESSNFN